MKTVLILAILSLAVVVHANVAHRYECDKEALDGVLHILTACEITFEFIAQFLVPEAVIGQSSQIEIATVNKTTLRSKRNIEIPDGWAVDFGSQIANIKSKPLTMEERMEKLEGLMYCVEEEVKANKFCVEVYNECERKIAEAPEDSESLFGCFFEGTCERCPEFVVFILGDLKAINKAY